MFVFSCSLAKQVRRIQLKFRNDVDFIKVLNIVRDLGLPITGTAPAPASVLSLSSRPRHISPSPSLLSDKSSSTLSSVSSASTRLSLPTSKVSSYPKIQANNEQLTVPSDLLTTEFKVPMRPNSSFSEPQKHTSSLPFTISQIPRPATTSNYFPLTGLNLPQPVMQPPTSMYIKQLEREVRGITQYDPVEAYC